MVITTQQGISSSKCSSHGTQTSLGTRKGPLQWVFVNPLLLHKAWESGPRTLVPDAYLFLETPLLSPWILAYLLAVCVCGEGKLEGHQIALAERRTQILILHLPWVTKPRNKVWGFKGLQGYEARGEMKCRSETKQRLLTNCFLIWNVTSTPSSNCLYPGS